VYNQGLEAFNEFRRECSLGGLWSIPLSEIVDFIAYMYTSGLAHSTVNCYIAGLSFCSKLNNFEDNTGAFVVRKIVDGVKRASLGKPDSRLPITRELLGRILLVLPSVCKSRYESHLFRAAFPLCYHGMVRISELTTLSNSAFNHAVRLGEVKRSKDGLEVFLKTSKTDQLGTGRTIYISSQNSKHLCPLLAVNNFLDCRPKIDGPLFCHYDSKPLTRYQFSAILKRCLSILGVPQSNLASHSFRIGMATQCSIDGYTDEHIKKLGRWRSSVYLRYSRIPK
jgi:site-specific recombinase XerD